MDFVMVRLPVKYVYHALVTDPDDILQLMAYCVYKAHKNNLAEQYKTEGDESYVERELKQFSQRTVKDQTLLENYRNVAKDLLQEIKDQELSRAKQALQSLHTEKMEKLRQEILNADKKAEEKWNKSVNDWAVKQTSPGILKRILSNLFKWIGGGISGLIATVFATWILVGFVALWDDGVRDPARNALKKGIDILIPDSPIDLGTVKKTDSGPEKVNKGN
jgi:hypothetical protein